MKIHLYRRGFVAFFLALSAVLAAVPVQAASGCAGGKCGITTTITPNMGTTGTQVTVSIESGGLPVGGKYELWWSKSATMQSEDLTCVRLASGDNPKLAQTATMSASIPETVNGIGYLHYIRAGRSEQMMNFSFTVLPSMVIDKNGASSPSNIKLIGTGFSALDKVSFYVDGEVCETTATTSELGSFTIELPFPQVMAGTHILKATASKMYNQDATLSIKSLANLKLEPALPFPGTVATVSGYGFTPNSDVSIKYDSIVVTSSPTSDKSGRFIYNFTVPESNESGHKITATDKSGVSAVYQVAVESNPPTTPTPVQPASGRYGVFGAQQVTFNWMPSKDDSGSVSYTLEISDNLNFFPLAAGMRRSGVTDTSLTIDMQPGTYYWRIQANDASGNKSKWALSPYPFQVGLINVWLVIAASLILLVIFVFLLRAFIQRIRGYYY